MTRDDGVAQMRAENARLQAENGALRSAAWVSELLGLWVAQGAVGPLAMPTPAQSAHRVGKYGALLVRRFL